MTEADEAPRRAGAGGRRLALCIGVTKFAPHPGYGLDGDGLDALPFAAQRVAEMKRVLEHDALAFTCTVLTGTSTTPGPTAEEIGDAIHGALAAASADDLLVIHVISHGVRQTTGLYAVGSDSNHLPGTSVAGWLAAVEDFPDRPTVILLLDMCHAGLAARQDYQLASMDGSLRAWVIAATDGADEAFEGRFSLAVAEVLAEVAEGTLQYDRGKRYVDLVWFGAQVRDRVDGFATNLRGRSQRVTGTPLDTPPPEIPFLPNPLYDGDPLDRVRSDVASELGDELGSFLDDVADLGHFRSHAQGGAGLAVASADPAATGLFTGRAAEAARLVDWLTDDGAARLCVVTGSPGVGKSALLGVVVCAAHSLLRERTRPLWAPLGRSIDPSAPLLAVHARQRTSREIVGSLARQLGLRRGDSEHDVPLDWPVERLVDALKRMAGAPPVVVIDALDEMRNPGESVGALLQVLAAATRLDGQPVCRLLLGTRDEEPLSALVETARATGELIDLDVARPREEEIRDYIGTLLSAALGASAGDVLPSGSDEFAAAGAAALAGTDGTTGPYLMAGLYVSYALQDDVRGSLADPKTARELGSRVPLTLSGLLDLSFDQDHAHQLLRPVLAAVAFAQGDGMPLETAATVARAFADDGIHVSSAEVGRLLGELRGFLRSAPDRDGTMLHRLLHQSVADELRRRPVHAAPDDTASPEVRVYDALVASVRAPVDGPPRWRDLNGYLGRHLCRHAVDAGRFDEFCAEPEFLVHADPDWLVPQLRHAASEPARSAAAVYRTSAHVHRRVGPEQRRHILALDAARHEASTLADRLADPSASVEPAMLWRPSWATGTRISAAHAIALHVPDDRVTALAAATVNGSPLVVTGARNGSVRVWDARNGRQLASVETRSGEIHSLLCTEVDGVPVLLGSAGGGALMLWTLPDLTNRHLPASGHTDTVRTIACGDVVGNRTALTADDSGRLMLWDLTDAPSVTALDVPGDSVQLVVLVPTDDEPDTDLAVFVDQQGTISFWSLIGEERVGADISHPSRVHAVVHLTVRGESQIATAGEDGYVRMWSTRTHELTGQSAVPHDGPVYALSVVSGPHGPRILSSGGDRDGTIRSWNPQDLTERRFPEDNRLVGHMGAVTSLVHAPSDLPVVASAGADPVVRVWHMPWERPRTTTPVGHTSWVSALAASGSDGQVLLASAGADGRIQRWRLTDGVPYGDPIHAAGPVQALTTFSFRGRMFLAAAGVDGLIRRWDLADGTPFDDPVDTESGPVHALAAAVLDDRPVLVSGGADGLIRCWDAETGRRRGLSLAGHRGGINALACLDLLGRTTVASCGDDGTLRLWDLKSGVPARAPINAHQGWATALACTLVDGTAYVVTGGQDGRVRIWGADDDFALRPPLEVTVGVNAFACGTAWGGPVLAAADDCAVRVWNLASGRLVESLGVPGTVPVLLLHDDHLVLGCEWEIMVLRQTGDERAHALPEATGR